MAGFLYDPENLPQGFDPTAITTFRVGIRFEPLGITLDSSDMKGKKNNDDEIWPEEVLTDAVHWALVFSHRSNDSSYRIQIELHRDGDKLLFPVRFFRHRASLKLGVWTGSWNDIMDLRKNHPMQGTEYSPSLNNCQHWVATMLVQMEELAKSTGDRSFKILDAPRYNRILGVVERNEGRVQHEFNSAMESLIIQGYNLCYRMAVAYFGEDDENVNELDEDWTESDEDGTEIYEDGIDFEEDGIEADQDGVESDEDWD
ncbi:hypothetical protein AA313_de0201850 [Arthrobotrys entomopaga]|nr:hypothetical protein AA313_de0201850 [Arthrobotrys entomopaga]